MVTIGRRELLREGLLASGCVAAALMGAASPARAASARRVMSSGQADRSSDLWRHYMHGITDRRAAPVDTRDLFSPSLVSRIAFEDVRIEPMATDRTIPAIVLPARQRLTSARSLPITPSDVTGRTVRVFTWVRGEDTGRRASPNSYADPPGIALEMRDGRGNLLARSSGMTGIGTTGTFPWHCYHVEMFVPLEATVVHVEIENSAGGRAWFGGFSWEIVGDDNAFTLDERQDPATGSVASNVYYDELNRQFSRGMPRAHPWRFLQGPTAGLLGQPYDITTTDGLRAYFDEKIRTDADHVNHSLMYFASRYHFGRENDLLPAGMDEDWLAQLRELVLGAQDPETGYWGSGVRRVSMGQTFHLVDGLFAYHEPKRPDAPDVVDERRSLGMREIPHADRIIRTTLALQANEARPRGTPAPAAWPQRAYDFTDVPNSGADRASLVVTGNAIELLRRASRFVDADVQQDAYRAIRAAVRYVLETCVQDDGVWRQSDRAKEPTTRSYMERILGLSQYLERRIDETIATPRVEATRNEQDDQKTLLVRWIEPAAVHNSLRIYVAADTDASAAVDERALAAVIHRTGRRIVEMDPLLAARRMGEASTARWGIGWNRASYVGEKVMGRLPAHIVVANDLAPVRLAVSAGHRVWASAVTWYGEESRTVPVTPDDRERT